MSVLFLRSLLVLGLAINVMIMYLKTKIVQDTGNDYINCGCGIK